MPILTTTLLNPQFSFSQHFEQSNCSLPRFLYDAQSVTISLKWLHVFKQQNNAQAISILSIASALQLSKSGLSDLKLSVTLGGMRKVL